MIVILGWTAQGPSLWNMQQTPIFCQSLLPHLDERRMILEKWFVRHFWDSLSHYQPIGHKTQRLSQTFASQRCEYIQFFPSSLQWISYGGDVVDIYVKSKTCGSPTNNQQGKINPQHVRLHVSQQSKYIPVCNIPLLFSTFLSKRIFLLRKQSNSNLTLFIFFIINTSKQLMEFSPRQHLRILYSFVITADISIRNPSHVSKGHPPAPWLVTSQMTS